MERRIFSSRPALTSEEIPDNGEPIFNGIFKFLNGESIKTNKELIRTARKFVVEDVILFRKSREGLLKVVYISEELKGILMEVHDDLGHFAFETIWGLVKGILWRPKLYQEVKEYVISCHQCQKYHLSKPSYRFNGKSAVSGIFTDWKMDFLGPITKSNTGNRYILVAVETFKSYSLAWPTKDLTSETVAEHLLDLIEVFGIPKSLNTEGGRCFKA
ncbi:Gypsy retrotransposon integrase-like protein 1 [Smittium culicis]|uniref:Gypsy retrotransposon integrase-like protein 1 n=1 Tax=Smittium culicis TaxID=133412 RepID=A0A1R1XMV2_9FUNG|nr:Gypsy retrotransposon integrase-like protein 1 [Smittium culicis]